MPLPARTLAAATLVLSLALPRASHAFPLFSPARQIAPSQSVVSPEDVNAADQNPTAATNGTDFLVAWSDRGAVECARVAAAGPTLLDQPSLPLSLTGASPRAFWDGAKYIVVASGQAQRIDAATGAVEPPFALAGAGATGAAAVGGGVILDAWQASDGLLQARTFDLTGAPTAAGVALPSGSASAWTVAFSAGQFLVAWATPENAIAAARFSPAGALLDASPLYVVGPSADGGALPIVADLEVAGSPDQYLVSWLGGAVPYDYSYASRVSTGGVVADPGGVHLDGIGYAGAPVVAAWDGTEWWIVGNNSEYSVAETLGSIGSPSATVEYDGFPAATIAANAGARLAVTSFDLSISAAAVTTSGAGSVLETAQSTLGIAVSTYPSPQTPVCAVASSAGYLVTWREVTAVYGVRFGLDGTPIDSAPFVLGQGGTACGARAGEYYVGTLDLQGDGYVPDVKSLPTTGPLVLAQHVVSLAADGGNPYFTSPASMACLSDRCLVLANDSTLEWGTIFGADGGVVLPPTNLTWNSPFGTGVTAAASDGASFLVLLLPEDETSGILPVAADGTPSAGGYISEQALGPSVIGGGPGVFFAAGATAFLWLDGTGALLGTAPAPGSMYASAIAWDGAGFFVAGASSVAMEVPALPYDGGAGPVVSSPLFTNPSGIVAASDGAGHVVVLTAQPELQGGFSTETLVARFGQPASAVVDGGGDDGGDAGISGGDAGTSATGADDAGAASDADAASPGPVPDATAPGGSSASDAAVDGNGDGESAAASSTSGGCGCTAAGAGSTCSGAWVAFAALALLRVRRGARSRLT